MTSRTRIAVALAIVLVIVGLLFYTRPFGPDEIAEPAAVEAPAEETPAETVEAVKPVEPAEEDTAAVAAPATT
ncbi:MAG: hypothetical protein KJO67_12660, partial [Silicimonas sp.]|nr:hypothetical protein [Silicimonas sp.]